MSAKNIYDPIGEVNLSKFEVLNNSVPTMPGVLLKLISEYWFLFSEICPRFIPNYTIHNICDVNFSRQNGKIILATESDRYYVSNLLIYDLSMRLISRGEIDIRVKKILSSKLTYPDDTIYIVFGGNMQLSFGESFCIIICSYHGGIFKEFLKIWPFVEISDFYRYDRYNLF